MTTPKAKTLFSDRATRMFLDMLLAASAEARSQQVQKDHQEAQKRLEEAQLATGRWTVGRQKKRKDIVVRKGLSLLIYDHIGMAVLKRYENEYGTANFSVDYIRERFVPNAMYLIHAFHERLGSPNSLPNPEFAEKRVPFVGVTAAHFLRPQRNVPSNAEFADAGLWVTDFIRSEPRAGKGNQTAGLFTILTDRVLYWGQRAKNPLARGMGAQQAAIDNIEVNQWTTQEIIEGIKPPPDEPEAPPTDESENVVVEIKRRRKP